MEVREKFLFDADGNTVRVIRTQDTEPILDALKERSTHYTTNLGGSGKYLGTIPPIVAVEWAKECGAAIGTKEWLVYAKKKLKSNEWLRLKGA